MPREQCHFSVLAATNTPAYPQHPPIATAAVASPTLRRRAGAINLSHVPGKLISQKINFN